MFRSKLRNTAKPQMGGGFHGSDPIDWGCGITFIILLRLLVSMVLRIKITQAMNMWTGDELVTERLVVVI